MKNTGILKQELMNLEHNAETLERIVMNDLTALETLPEESAEKYEAKVLRKLHRLDALQEEIDRKVAQLKEAGEYEPVRQGLNIYQYRPPKEAKKEDFTERAKRKRTQKSKTAWDRFSETLGEDGRFTIEDVASELDTDVFTCRSKINHWKARGYIESAEKHGRNVVYRSRAKCERLAIA